MKKIVKYTTITDGNTLYESDIEYREISHGEWQSIDIRYNGSTLKSLCGSMNKYEWRKPIYKLKIG